VRGPIGKGPGPALIVDEVQQLVKTRQRFFGRLHLERADKTQRLIEMRPCEGHGIGAPLTFDRHRNLIVADPVEIPFVMFRQMLHDVDRMEFFGQKLLGQCHCATSFYGCSARAGLTSSARCLL